MTSGNLAIIIGPNILHKVNIHAGLSDVKMQITSRNCLALEGRLCPGDDVTAK